MVMLGDLYSDFTRIDLDTRGGYARVAKVRAQRKKGFPEYCAFKLMRHDLESPLRGIDRFEGEIRTLLNITQNKNFPTAITKIYDCGIVSVELSKALQKPRNMIENVNKIQPVNPKFEIVSAGTNFERFLELRSELLKRKTDQLLPYLAVELAPYDDNLLRQIRQLSSGDISDLYRLSVREIISMALQLLDVIDELHNKHNFAYVDWKPEHIYWNSLNAQLRVIDWNVINKFQNEREKREFVREDIRLFCGAALYCSLALNDPEDLKRPIGPRPSAKPNPMFSSMEPRYWTDQPNFYDRDFILDDKIKLIIQKGLDPQQGFNTPQELKNELLTYSEQELGLTAIDLSPHAISQEKLAEIKELLVDAEDAYHSSEYHRSVQLFRRVLRIEPDNEKAKTYLAMTEAKLSKADDGGEKIPREAMQLYRSARSYISARDYQEAIKKLADAIEIAFRNGTIFQEAQQLLASVKTSMEIEKIRRNIKTALEEEKWNAALDLYKKALDLDPDNNILKLELDALKELIKTDTSLREQGIRKYFTPLNRLQNQLETTRDALNQDNAILVFIENQIKQIKQVRFSFSLVIIILVCITVVPFINPGIGFIQPLTDTPTTTVSPIPTNTVSHTSTSTKTVSTPVIASTTVVPTASETLTPSPTPMLATIGTGYVILGKISAWDNPNGKFLTTLKLNQVVTIYKKVNDHGADWYQCTWESNGITEEGWVLAQYIKIGNPPTQRP